MDNSCGIETRNLSLPVRLSPVTVIDSTVMLADRGKLDFLGESY